jgi:hypothetical protein
MHKGYTLNYFINFFENTKPSEWVCGQAAYIGKDGKQKYCAVGWAGAYDEIGNPASPAREEALVGFIGNIVDINDANNKKNFYNRKLGRHPRTRVIKALKLRKKHGPDWEETL